MNSIFNIFSEIHTIQFNFNVFDITGKAVTTIDVEYFTYPLSTALLKQSI